MFCLPTGIMVTSDFFFISITVLLISLFVDATRISYGFANESHFIKQVFWMQMVNHNIAIVTYINHIERMQLVLMVNVNSCSTILQYKDSACWSLSITSPLLLCSKPIQSSHSIKSVNSTKQGASSDARSLFFYINSGSSLQSATLTTSASSAAEILQIVASVKL